MTTLADRLNQIIREQNITKRDFAKRIGVSENYIYILTGSRGKNEQTPLNLSMSLAKLIAVEFGYDVHWILNGDKTE